MTEKLAIPHPGLAARPLLQAGEVKILSNFNRPLRTWLLNHLRACWLVLKDLLKAPISSIVTLLVIGIAMALPLGLYVILQTFQTLSSQWHAAPTISLYLKQDVSPEKLSTLMTKLNNWPNVARVHYVSSEQGMKEFQQETVLKDILRLLPKNPLPGVFVITPKINQNTVDSLSQLFSSLQKLNEVEVNHLDREWVERLANLLTFTKRVTYSLALLFAVAGVLITVHTIRLITQKYSQTVNLFKLIGATRGFIRRPFLYRGFLLGFGGSVVACVLLESLIVCLYHPALQLLQGYQITLGVPNFHLVIISYALIIGSLLGWIGSYLAIFPYLRAAEQI